MSLQIEKWFDRDLNASAGGAPPPAPFTSSAMDNPIARKQGGSLDVTQALVLSTLAVIVATVPFKPMDTSQQVRPAARPQQPLHARANGSPTVSAPFFVEDTSAQVTRVGLPQSEIPQNLVLRQVSTPAPVGKAQTDYTPPRITVQQVGSLRNALLLSERPTGAQTLVVVTKSIAAQQPDNTQNLLVTTLAPSAPPIRPVDLNQPPLARVAQQPLHSRAEGSPTAPVSGTPPFTPYDFTMPVRPQGLHASQAFDTVVYEAPPPLPPGLNFDWPNPTLARKVQQPLHARADGTPAAPPAANPLPIGQATFPYRLARVTGYEAQGWEAVLYLPPDPLPPGSRSLLDPTRALARTPQDHVAGTNPFTFPPPTPIPVGAQRGEVTYRWDTKPPANVGFTYGPNPDTIPPYIPVEPPASTGGGGGGGGGGRIHYWAKHHRKHAPDRHLAKLLDDVVAETLYRDLRAEDEKQARAAGAAVKPHSADKRYVAPPPEAINWDALTRDVEAVAALLKLYREREQQRQIDDEDDEWLLLED